MEEEIEMELESPLKRKLVEEEFFFFFFLFRQRRIFFLEQGVYDISESILTI
jgi:hypothetical protein